MANKKLEIPGFTCIDQTEGTYILPNFPDFQGYFEPGRGTRKTINFTVNVAPEEIDGGTSKGIRLGIIEHAAYMLKISAFIMALEDLCKVVRLESDFYWTEGDLNLRITVIV